MTRISSKKQKIVLSFLLIYETIRAFSILYFPSVITEGTVSFPPSLYYSTPLLIIPILIVLGILFELQKLSNCKILLPIIKLLSTVSYIGFVVQNLNQIVQEFRFGKDLPALTLIFLMIFFVIDVIIGLIFVNNERNTKSEKDELTLCK